MKRLQVYLFFNGNCAAALDFYRECLDGEIVSLQTFEGSPMAVPEHYQTKVMHAEFKAGEITFMASDGTPDRPSRAGDNISLVLDFSDPAAQSATFDRLAEGGSVTMPLQDTFWGSTFGMLVDKFGIHWMFNHTQTPA